MRQILICALLFSALATKAQISSPDSMANRLFTVLKNKDDKGFITLHPNQEQMMRLTSRMIRGMAEEFKKAQPVTDTAALTPENGTLMDSILTAALMKKSSQEDMQKFQAKQVKEFGHRLLQGEAKGIDWSTIQLDRYTLDTANLEDASALQLFGAGMRAMRGIFYFNNSGTPYSIAFDKVMFMPEEGGWYGGEFGTPLRAGETDPEEESKEEDPSDKPTRAKPKPKAKTSTSKSKTKSKA